MGYHLRSWARRRYITAGQFPVCPRMVKTPERSWPPRPSAVARRVLSYNKASKQILEQKREHARYRPG